MFKKISQVFITFILLNSLANSAETMMDHSQMSHSGMGDSSMKAEEMDHSKMTRESSQMPNHNSGKNTQVSPVLVILKQAPASGKAREAGYDNNYNMKQTTTEVNLSEKCALASRGIIMLDRASWKKCDVTRQNMIKKSDIRQHSGHE